MRPDPFSGPGDDGQEPDSGRPPAELEAGQEAGLEAGPAQQGLFLCLPAGSLDTGQFAQAGPAAAGEGCAEEFAADQLAHELHLTTQSAAAQMDYARTVAVRLPHTFAALAAGRLHPVHVRIVEDETSILPPQDAARADAELAEVAGSLTFGKLRSAAHRLVLELDPQAAQRRKETARQDAHVRRFREDSGNAGIVARELPSAEVLASWQHVEQRALDLRAAGVPGTLQELRVRAYLDLLQERDSRLAPAVPDSTGTPETVGPDDGSGADDGGGPGRPGRSPGGPGRGPFGGPGGSGRARPPGQEAGPSLAALVNITVPWSAVTGQSGTPGRRGRVRPGRGVRCPRPDRPGGPRPLHALVCHGAVPRRDRGRSRLRRRPASPARHQRPGPADPRLHPRARPAPWQRPEGHDRPPAHPDDPDRPRHLRPPSRRTRLPAQPQAPAPGPHP
ncbi:MAG TPA: DUF222 domain-containing protein [Streptosporangiaceae bacterium]|nr:DUF222 domain-containing protein [Streptosporangiaceae bacterium]